MHVNPRHHSLAFIQTGKNAVHHIMMELFSSTTSARATTSRIAEEGRIATTLGRHTNDFITSFYTWTPSDFMVEYGWGGRSIDPETWQPLERNEGPSLWGHDRTWLPPTAGEVARDARQPPRRPAPAGAGDRGQLRGRRGHLRLVGRRAPRAVRSIGSPQPHSLGSWAHPNP